MKLFSRIYRRLEIVLSAYWYRAWGTMLTQTVSSERINYKLCGMDIPKADHVLWELAAYYQKHRFDLLGSGWITVFHGMDCNGIEGIKYHNPTAWDLALINRSNRTAAGRIWSLLAHPYTPIDWQIDFKSGYRWSERTVSRQITYQRLPGVDIKVPWELGRMQHLPQMALYHNSLPHDADERHIIQREVRNQILDFIAMNPPCFGVQWVSSMEVAIRAANWLLTLDILRVGGHQYDSGFSSLITQSIFQHAKHVKRHLSIKGNKRHNHYLVEICGLAIISAYLPVTQQTDTWFAFTIQALIKEVQYQFLPDGTNFEGSTAYHRYTTECVYFATAYILGELGSRRKQGRAHTETPFPPWYFEKLERMAEFMASIRKPDGTFPQIGDNDNGRLFKLTPSYTCLSMQAAKQTYSNLSSFRDSDDISSYLMENHLDGDHLLASACAFFQRPDFEDLLGGRLALLAMPDYVLLKYIASINAISSQRLTHPERLRSITTSDTPPEIQMLMSKAGDLCKRTHGFKFPVRNCLNKLEMHAYSDFGLYIYRSEGLYLAMRCWGKSPPYTTGHRHYDQLSIELVINGVEHITDPGTYVYTPLPDARKEYRSSRAHSVPYPWDAAKTNAPTSRGVFAMNVPLPPGKMLFTSVRHCWCGSGEVQRWVAISDDEVRVTDFYEGAVPFLNYDPPFYSPGYGSHVSESHHRDQMPEKL
jgi:hypothetical protein